MQNKYEKENYVHMENYWAQYMPKVLLEHYKSYFVGTIGDFGCNAGLFDLHLASLPNVKQVIGYDINAKAIEQANVFAAATADLANKVKFFHRNLAGDPEQLNYFDFIFSFHTLEHVYPEDVDSFVANIFYSLKPNKFLLLNLPDKDSYSWEASHVYRPNKKELCALVERHGFKTIEAYEDERGGQVGPSRNITALFQK